MAKFIFVSGGVVSGLGKGITGASLGRLLKARGYRVTMMKMDPYLNVDPGTMNPIQHGEVFVTDDGAETDLDLGHYERFIDENLTQGANITSGRIYWNVIRKERHGDFGGGTVQVIPHVTNEIKEALVRMEKDTDIVIAEVGGTVGDIESQAFFEAIRQFQQERGPKEAIMIHVTYMPYLFGSQEMKTKPTQQSVRALQQMGIHADLIVLRAAMPVPFELRKKVALFCNMSVEDVFENLNAKSLYEVPLMLEKEHLAQRVLKHLGLPSPRPDLTAWKKVVYNLQNPVHEVEIALVGKYTQLHDSYLSVVEALSHGGIRTRTKVNIRWVDAECLEGDKPDWSLLEGIDGMIIPGGFGSRGIEGMVRAAGYARDHKIPYLGICLGMQIAMVSFARDRLGFADAASSEWMPESKHPVIDLMPEQKDVEDLGGTMRLGAYPCHLTEGSLARELYGTADISERHRHRYEVNNEYREDYEKAGMRLSGLSPDNHIVEMVEIKDHPYYVATQAHPEFRSRPTRPHPLFQGLVEAALKYQKENSQTAK